MSTCSVPGCKRFVGVHRRCWAHAGSQPLGRVFDLVEREWTEDQQTFDLRAPMPVKDGICFHGFRSYLDCGECLNAADLDVGFGAHR